MLKSRRKASRTVSFEKLESRQVMTASAASATLDRTHLDWFDTHLADAAIRSSVRGAFDDGLINRHEMIKILRDVADQGAISSTELTSLRTIVNNNSLFTGMLYVQVLAKDVVLGNTANAHYQQHRLGNLKVGSAGSHLDKLIDKWFLGKDLPLATYEGADKKTVTLEYAQAEGNLFGPSIRYRDVRQGALGDCYFLAALAETAHRTSNRVRALFTDNADGTFTVRFLHSGQAEFVTVNLFLPVNDEGKFVFANSEGVAKDANNILWVALAEKAYVQMNESGWLRTPKDGGGKNSYQAIAFGYEKDVFKQVAGVAAGRLNLTARSGSFQTIVRRYGSGQLLTFGSKEKNVSPIVAQSHAYAMVSYSLKKQTVTFYNPWGFTMAKQRGLITLTWSQVKRSFSNYTWSA